MRIILKLLFLLISTNYCFAQRIEPFKLSGTPKMWGIKIYGRDSILIKPKYKKIKNYSDSLIAVKDFTDKYGIVDLNDQLIVPFSVNQTYIEIYNKYHKGEIIEYPEFWEGGYYIDHERQCLAYDYYPCPYWKKPVNTPLQKHLDYIQQANYYQAFDKKDSAIIYCDSAILASSNNPYVYLEKVNVIMYYHKFKRLTLSSDEIKQIDTLLTKSINLENRDYYRVWINNIRYNFYKKDLKNRNNLKLIREENCNKDLNIYRNGWFGFIGFNYEFLLFGHEIGFGKGFINKRTNYNFANYLQEGIIFIGASWIKDYNKNLDGYKLYLLSFTKPINFGLFPILYTNYKTIDAVLRPEIGVGLDYFTFTLGYNINLDKDKFSNVESIGFNLRWYFPIITSKSYTFN